MVKRMKASEVIKSHKKMEKSIKGLFKKARRSSGLTAAKIRKAKKILDKSAMQTEGRYAFYQGRVITVISPTNKQLAAYDKKIKKLLTKKYPKLRKVTLREVKASCRENLEIIKKYCKGPYPSLASMMRLERKIRGL